jgi:hypothetical protein
MRFVAALVGLVAMSAASAAVGQENGDGLTAQQIVDKLLAKESIGFSQGAARVKLTIENKRGQQRVRTVDSKSTEVDGLRWTLATFVEPADVAGTKLLSKEVNGADDLQYLYLPALKEKRRIAGAAKNESFMGTDFTYNDLEQKAIEESTYERLGDEKHSGIDCYRIDATPKDKDNEYSKLSLWIDKKDIIPLKIYFYDRKGEHYKTLVAQMIEPIDGEMSITQLLMKNVKKGSKTTMNLESVNRKAVFPKAVFDESSLDK